MNSSELLYVTSKVPSPPFCCLFYSRKYHFLKETVARRSMQSKSFFWDKSHREAPQRSWSSQEVLVDVDLRMWAGLA